MKDTIVLKKGKYLNPKKILPSNGECNSFKIGFSEIQRDKYILHFRILHWLACSMLNVYLHVCIIRFILISHTALNHTKNKTSALVNLFSAK